MQRLIAVLATLVAPKLDLQAVAADLVGLVDLADLVDRAVVDPMVVAIDF